MLVLGASTDEAVEYLVGTGLGRVMLETIPEPRAREVAIADVRATLLDHSDQSAARLRGGVWMVTAAVPEVG